MTPSSEGISTEHGPTLSIVMMLRHDAQLAQRCLASASSTATEVGESELIIVLNQASEEVRAVAAKLAPDAHVIDSPVNTGTAVGWQLGFTKAKGEFVLLLHEDAETLPGMTSQLLRTIRSEPGAAAIGPWIDELRGEPHVNAGWLRFGRLGAGLRADQLPERLAQAPYAVNEISTAISLWRRSAWLELGGFDERTYPAMGVEPDTFTGLWARGWSVLVDPNARGRHNSGAMDHAPGLLSGPHLRHYLTERFFELWSEKWAARANWFLGDEDPENDTDQPSEVLVSAALERVQALRLSPPALSDPPPQLHPLTNPDRSDRGPTTVDRATAERIRAAEREVIDGYTRWLVNRDVEMTNRYEDAYAAYAELGDRVEALEERSRTLDAILNGRWWRLRAGILRTVGR